MFGLDDRSYLGCLFALFGYMHCGGCSDKFVFFGFVHCEFCLRVLGCWVTELMFAVVWIRVLVACWCTADFGLASLFCCFYECVFFG